MNHVLVDWVYWKIKALLTPSCWLQSDGALYNRYFDAWILDKVSEGDAEALSRSRMRIGHLTIWYGNHPYASFRPVRLMPEELEVLKIRPSRATILKLMQILKRNGVVK